MKKKIFACIFLCFFCAVLPGCGKKAAQKTPLCRVVTQVEITGQEKDVQFYRKYTSEEKTKWLLLYLNAVDPDIRPAAPPTEPLRSHYQITLTFSDGKHKIFQQVAHRFFREESRPWRSFSPAQASGLYTLLRKLPSDL